MCENAVEKMTENEKKMAVRGNVFDGLVKSAKAPRTVTVEREIVHFVSKYERYKKTRSRIRAHVPEGMKINEGDLVRIGETRRISKTKSFVVLEILQKALPKRLIEEVPKTEEKKGKSHEGNSE